MATLIVRPLAARDIPHLFHVRQRCAVLAPLERGSIRMPGLAGNARAVLPKTDAARQVFVAFVDDELCAYVVVEPELRRYCWDVLAVASGSPRLDANDDVSTELWTALFEYSIRRAGEAHVKRLFASVPEGGAAHESLGNAGFEAYTRLTVVSGRGMSRPYSLPEGMRRQEPSDVWSIHQIYHRTTPRAVQFAEALTSATWEDADLARHWRLPLARRPPSAFVLETRHGIAGYCRVDRRSEGTLLRLLMQPDQEDRTAEFALASAAESGLGAGDRVCVIIPAYAQHWISSFEAAGFAVEAEQLAMVRHTTVPAVVHAGLAPVPALEAVERVPRGVPTYLARRRAPRVSNSERFVL